MKEELKPCPFCGGNAEKHAYPLDYPNWNTCARVYCLSCGAEIRVLGNIETLDNNKVQVVKLWNRRETK